MTSIAQENGGVRSILSEGAGNRALAMGSAFAAIADDASAILWNAGGLARVPRLELQAAQAGYNQVSGSLVAVASPSWRWGTVAAAYRHFSAGGIERRDERNLLIDDGLAYAESELLLGYGRGIGEAFGLGGSLKARRQTLAGYGASAFGIDIGVMAQPALLLGRREGWAQNVSCGLAISNLVEPSLRLDRESVPDPMGVRLGLAYRHTSGPFRTLVAAIDLENARGLGTVVHAGMEVTVQSLLTMRAGMNGGTFTSGTGLRWNDLALDYTYEQSALESVHHVGLAYGFGATVSESREAARRAEEEAIQARLAEAFQKRQAAQVAALLAEVERKRDAEDFDEALDLLATINALEPGHPRVPALELECLKDKAALLERRGNFADAAATFGRARTLAPDDSVAVQGERRCQAESDLRAARSADLRRQFADAVDDFGADRLADARSGFRAILAADSSDAEARDMLRRTELAIERRAQGLSQQAYRYLRANLWSEALQLADQIEALDQNAPGLVALNSAIARSRAADAGRPESARESQPRPTPAADRPVLTRQKQRELELLYRRGLDAMNRKQSDDALRYWELVWSTDPTFQNVAEVLKREYLTRGMESFAAGRLDEAVGFWERALQIDPKDAKAIGYLQRAQKQLSRTREILRNER